MSAFRENREARKREDELKLSRDAQRKNLEAQLSVERMNVQLQVKAASQALGVKSLIAINGGGAIALGALFQAMLGKPEAELLMRPVLEGIGILSTGVALSACIFPAEYFQVTIEARTGRYRWNNPLWWVRWALVVMSVATFVIAMFRLVSAGLNMGPLLLS